jgi:hypothetical protein
MIRRLTHAAPLPLARAGAKNLGKPQGGRDVLAKQRHAGDGRFYSSSSDTVLNQLLGKATADKKMQVKKNPALAERYNKSMLALSTTAGREFDFGPTSVRRA